MRCKLRQTLDGLREAAPGSVAGLQGDDARAYALGFMAEYLSPKRLAQLAESCGLQATGGFRGHGCKGARHVYGICEV